MWDLIVLVPDHCLSFYYANFAHVCKSIFYFAFTRLYGSKSISLKK